MPTKFSYHTYYHSYSMSTEWMSCGIPDSLKAETRSKRGKGVRRRVEACNASAIPGIWQDDNKAELFSYVYLVSALDAGKQVISTHHADVLCSQPRGT